MDLPRRKWGVLQRTRKRKREHVGIVLRKRKQEVNVSKFFCQWLEQGASTPVVVELAIPPVVLPDGTSKSLWTALRNHASIRQVQRLKEALLRCAAQSRCADGRAGMAFDIDQMDAASSNAKYHAAAVQRDCALIPELAKGKVLCQNHQNQHCLVAPFGANSVIPTAVVSSLHTTVTFLKMGSYMLRLACGIRSFVKTGALQVHMGDPPPEDRALAEMLLEFLPAHAGCGKKERQHEYARNLRALLQLWNGYNGLQHFCRGEDCCCGGGGDAGRKMLEDKLAELLADVLCQAPTTPSLSKWTQLGESTTWCAAFFLGGVGPALFQHVTAVENLNKLPGEQPGQDLSAALDSFIEDVNWHALAGKRFRLSAAKMKDDEWRTTIVLISVVLEPLMRLCSYHVEVSCSEVHVHKMGFPPCVDLMNPRASLLHQTLSYYATMLVQPAACSRLALIYRQRGCRTLRQWFAEFPGDARRLAQCVLCVSAAIEHRQVRHITSQLEALALCDLRVPLDRRAEMARSLAARRTCCMEPGVTRAIVQRFQSESASSEAVADQLLQLQSQKVFFFVGHFVKLSIATIERTHAVHAKLARCRSQHCSVPWFTSAAVCHSTWGYFHKWRAEELSAQLEREQSAALPSCRRSKSAYEIFRTKYLEGTSLQRNSPAVAEIVRRAWGEASVEERQRCEDEERRSKEAALRWRRARAAAKAALAPALPAVPPPPPLEVPDAADASFNRSSVAAAAATELAVAPLVGSPEIPASACLATATYDHRVRSHPAAAVAAFVGAPSSSSSGDVPSSPFDAEAVAMWRKSCGPFAGQPKRTLKQHEKAWRCRCKAVEDGAAGDDFPKAIRYETRWRWSDCWEL